MTSYDFFRVYFEVKDGAMIRHDYYGYDQDWGPEGSPPADPESYITNEGTCSNCGEKLDLDDLKALDYQEGPRGRPGGVQPSSESGPAVHWSYGTIACPGCHDRLPIETSD